MTGLFLFGGILSALMLMIPVVLILALLVILALRHDDDVDGDRAPAIYASLVAFVGLLTLLFAVTGVASSLAALTADDGGTSVFSDDGFSESGDGNDAAITGAVAFLLAGAAAAGLLAVHRTLFERRRSATGAAQRVHRAYLLTFCFVTALIAMVAGGLAAFALYRALFPGTAGADNRGDEIRTLVTVLVLFLGAGGLWRFHWRDLGFDVPPAAGVSAAGAP